MVSKLFNPITRELEEEDQEVLYVIGTKELLYNPKLIGDFKIGRSTLRSIDERLRSIQTGNPNTLTVYMKVPYFNRRMEIICHRELEKNKHRGIVKRKGEWFRGELDTIIQIIMRSVMMYDTNKRYISKIPRRKSAVV